MPRNNKFVILLIEDNPSDIRQTELNLEDAPNEYHLIKATTFREGSEATERYDDIDLVLLDLTLPDMQGGIKALERFLTENSDKPVIILSGNSNYRLAVAAVKSGAQDYLLKTVITSFWLDRSIQHALQRFHITKELEAANQELELHRNRMSIAQTISNLGEWELDLVSNRMIWSEHIYQLFGFPKTLEPRMRDYMEKVHPEDKEAVSQFFERSPQDGQTHSIEHRIMVDGYKIKYLKLTAKLISIERIQKLVLIGSIQDISERFLSKQMAVDKVLAQQANAIWQRIVGELNFQIRTPLSKLLNSINILFPEAESINPKHKELRDQIHQSSTELSSSITKILNFSLLLTDHLTLDLAPFQLDSLNQQAEKLIQGSSRFRSLVKYRSSEAPSLTLLGDQGKLLLLSYNLGWFSMNKSTPGQSLFYASHFEAGESGEASGQLELSFEIDSWQISANEKEELLQLNNKEFQREFLLEVNPPDETNLILQAIHRLLPVLKAKLFVEDQEQGTKIRVSIPTELVKPPSASDILTPIKPLNILIVDDHPISRTVFNLALTRWSKSNKTAEAPNGKECLEMFNANQFDLILMDIQMPELDGLQTTEIIRQSSTIPIIGLSAKATKQEREAALNAGMNDYLVKPVDKEDLFAAINNLFHSL